MIPKTENEKEFLNRLQKLESKTFDGTFEQNYEGSPREQAERISENGQNHFLGNRTKESASQRITAFYQNYDKDSVNSLHGAEFIQYQREVMVVEMLVKKYHLQKLQQELIHK